MMKRLPIRLKLAVLYVNMTIFTIPNLILSYLFIKRLNELPAGAGTAIVDGFRWGYVIFVLVYLMVTIFLGRKIAKAIAYPIRDLDRAATALSQGDNNVALDYEAGDEIGELFSDFRKMAASIREQAAVLDSISHGDYTVSIAARSENDVINHSIVSILEKNNSMLSEIQGASAQVSSASTQIADGAQALSQGASEQAGAVENLSASIGRVLTQTAANTQDTNSALEVVNDSSRQMELTLASM